MKTFQKKCLFLNSIRKKNLYDSNLVLNEDINLSVCEIEDLIEWGKENNFIKGILGYEKQESGTYQFKIEDGKDRITIHGCEFLEDYYDTHL